MKQKLEKEYKSGYKDGYSKGQDDVNEAFAHMAELEGMRKGVKEAWALFDDTIKQIPGIGPKTREKVLRAMQEHARKEKENLK